jgi:integrase
MHRMTEPTNPERADQRRNRIFEPHTILSNNGGIRIEDISDLMGHSGTSVTETVYRHEIRPALTQSRDRHEQDPQNHTDQACGKPPRVV